MPIIGIITFGIIGWQSFETRRAANAMQASVGHMERGLALQEVALRQWVAIEDWLSVGLFDNKMTPKLQIQFDVVNPTPLPLTLKAG